MRGSVGRGDQAIVAYVPPGSIASDCSNFVSQACQLLMDPVTPSRTAWASHRSSVGVPEGVRLFIAKGSFPAVDHLELAPHRREHRSMAPANGHETSHGPAVTLDDHLLPILD